MKMYIQLEVDLMKTKGNVSLSVVSLDEIIENLVDNGYDKENLTDEKDIIGEYCSLNEDITTTIQLIPSTKKNKEEFIRFGRYIDEEDTYEDEEGFRCCSYCGNYIDD